MVRPVCSAMTSLRLPKNDVDLVCGQGFSTHWQSSPRSQNKAIYSTKDLISLSVQGALADFSSDCKSCRICNKKKPLIITTRCKFHKRGRFNEELKPKIFFFSYLIKKNSVI